MENLDKQLAVHEAVCAERYAHIMEKTESFDKRLEKIERLVLVLIVAVVGLHPTLVDTIKGFL